MQAEKEAESERERKGLLLDHMVILEQEAKVLLNIKARPKTDIKRTHREGEKRKKETGEMEHTCVKYTQAATMCARQQVISYM